MEREKIRVTVEVPGNKADSLMGDAILMVVIDGDEAKTYAVSHGATANTVVMGTIVGIADLDIVNISGSSGVSVGENRP